MLNSREGSKLNVRRLASWSLLLVFLLLGCQVLFGNVEVTQRDPNNAVSCVTGEFRCNGEYLLTCGSKETGWMLMMGCASSDLCDAKNHRCALCRDGDYRCDGASRQQCASDGSHWNTVEQCAAEDQCSESSCGTCPTEGALDCSSGAKLRECHDGVWKVLDTCASTVVCNNTVAQAMSAGADWDRKCVAPGCSPPGGYKCDDRTLQRCASDQGAWETVDTCASPEVCAQMVDEVTVKAGIATAADAAADPNASAVVDSCKSGCPTPGAFFCAGNTLQQCRTDQVSYETVKVCEATSECDPVNGVCGELCTPGHYQCNAAALRKCGADGHWKEQSTCETPELCSVTADGTEGHCTVSPCATAEYKCDGASLQKCKKDRTGYQEIETCLSTALCEATSGRCTEPACPTADAYRCFGQDLKQCATDLTKWKDVKSCPTGQYCDSGATPGCLTSCPANPLRCNGKVLEECSTAKGWVTKATCATADLCACTQTNPPSCSKGVFKDGCGNVACTANSFQCQGTKLQKCQAGQNGWDTNKDCGTHAWDAHPSLCYAGTAPAFMDGYCLTCPAAGELACNLGNGVLQVCSSDRRAWTDKNPSACANGCVPVNNGNDYCAVCKAGAVRCSGATLENCPNNANAWTSQKCTSEALCDAAHNQCDVCTKTTCSGATLQVCSADGQKQTNTACATAELCDATKGVCTAPVCAVGEKKCAGAELQVCNAGRTGFVLSKACDSAALCNKVKLVCDVPVCVAGTKQCNGAQVLACNADRTDYTVLVDTCASAALCNKTTLKCDAQSCKAGDTKCMGASLLTCKADLTGFDAGKACTNGCTGGACNGCSKGQHQCSSKGNSQVCSANLSGFEDVATCGTPGCNATTGLCNFCSKGEKKCNGTNVQVCNTAQTAFEDGPDCGVAGCSITTNTCNTPVCTAGSFNCGGPDGLEYQSCNPAKNAWVKEKVCELSCSKTAGCTDCDATSTPSCKSNTLKTCTVATGQWLTKDCGDNTCNPIGAGSCDPPVEVPPTPAQPAP